MNRLLIVFSMVLFASTSICCAQTTPKTPVKKPVKKPLQTLPTDPIAPSGGHEPIAQCIAQWGAPGNTGDCFCGAYPNETARYFSTIGSTKVLIVSFETDPVVSGGRDPNPRERGCWNLTPFKFPAGYALKAYQFLTTTQSGPCYLYWDSITGKTPNRAFNQKLHQENWQECQEWPHPEQQKVDLEFKFLMGYHPDSFGFVPATAMQGKGGMSGLDVQYIQRNFGSALITLYFVPN